MDAFQNLFLRRLAGRINSVISEKTGHLAGDSKSRAKDYADYVGRVEYLQALHDVAKWMTEIQQELTRPDDEEAPPARQRSRRPPIYES